MITLETIKEYIKNTALFSFKYDNEIESNEYELKSMSIEVPKETSLDLHDKYGIDIDAKVNEVIINDIVNNLTLDAISFYFNNFKEKDFTLTEHISHKKDGILVVSPLIFSEIREMSIPAFKEGFSDENSKTNLNHSIYPAGTIDNTLVTVNSIFSWNDRRLIWLKSKMFIYVKSITYSVDMNETYDKKLFIIKYSIRYPESFLGYLKENEK